MSLPLIIILIICCGIQVLAGIFEMVRWPNVVNLLMPGRSGTFIDDSFTLGLNMGLYNLFLAAGFAWAILSGDMTVALFFLVCMTAAGLFGGVTVKWYLYAQAAAPALGLVVAARL